MVRLSNDEIKHLYLNNDSVRYASLFNQIGNGLPHFTGIHSQEGQGIADLFKTFGIQALKRAAPHVLKGISNFVSDLNRGKNIKRSAKRRGVQTLKKSAKSIITGKGKIKKRKRIQRRGRWRRRRRGHRKILNVFKKKRVTRFRKKGGKKRNKRKRTFRKIPKSFALLS